MKIANFYVGTIHRNMRIANWYENCKQIWKLQTDMKIAKQITQWFNRHDAAGMNIDCSKNENFKEWVLPWRDDFLPTSRCSWLGRPDLFLKIFTNATHKKQKHIFLSFQQAWDVLKETGEQTKTSYLETFFAPIPSTTGTGQQNTYFLPLKSTSPISFLLARAGGTLLSSACKTSLFATDKTCSPEELEVSLVVLYVLTPLLTNQETHHPFLCSKNPQPQVTQKKLKKCQLSQSHLPALSLLPS